MKKNFAVILVLFALTACATDVTVTSPVAVPPTATPKPTETPLPPATAIPPTRTPEPTATKATNMTEADWTTLIPGGIIVGHRDGKQYKTEDILNKKYYTFLKNPAEILNLQPGTEIMVLNPSGEIIVWANPDEAAKRAAEGAVIVIPNANYGLDSAVKVILNSAFRAWEKNPTTPIRVKFGQYDANNAGPMMFFVDEIPLTNDGTCPVLEKPQFFDVMDENEFYLPESVGVTDPVLWLQQLRLKGYIGFTVFRNEESFNRFYPSSK